VFEKSKYIERAAIRVRNYYEFESVGNNKDDFDSVFTIIADELGFLLPDPEED